MRGSGRATLKDLGWCRNGRPVKPANFLSIHCSLPWVEIGQPIVSDRCGAIFQMETDLGTRLDWIAVDHHNTGHPHTHIVVRGVTDHGKIQRRRPQAQQRFVMRMIDTRLQHRRLVVLAGYRDPRGSSADSRPSLAHELAYANGIAPAWSDRHAAAFIEPKGTSRA